MVSLLPRLSWLDLEVRIAAICIVADKLWVLSAALVGRDVPAALVRPSKSAAVVRPSKSVALVRLSMERLGLGVVRDPLGDVVEGSWL